MSVNVPRLVLVKAIAEENGMRGMKEGGMEEGGIDVEDGEWEEELESRGTRTIKEEGKKRWTDRQVGGGGGGAGRREKDN